MSEENQQETVPVEEPVKKQYSEKELKEMRAKTLAFYKEEIKNLEPQSRYYKLLADIAENRYKLDLFKNKHAEYYMQQAQQDAEMKAQQQAFDEALANGEIDEQGNLTEKGQALMDAQEPEMKIPEETPVGTVVQGKPPRTLKQD